VNPPNCCSLVELRQYTLRPGRREEFIALFERELLDPQLAVGMHVAGLFRDVDRPDRVVWVRGFADAAARLRGLTSFYGGPVWARHRDAANATMLDSSDVHLLRPVFLGDDWPLPRTPPGLGGGRLEIRITAADDLPAELPSGVADRRLGLFVSSSAPNEFPRLPVRSDRVTVSITRAGDGKPSPVSGSTRPVGPETVLRVEPTDRSQLR
jgi:hypothetical protein